MHAPIIGVIDQQHPERWPAKAVPVSRNFPRPTAWYTRAIAYSLREFGCVKVVCSTIHVNNGVARSRIANAAFRLGFKVSTKLVRYHKSGERHDYVIGTVTATTGHGDGQ